MAHTVTVQSPIKTWDEFIATKDPSILKDYPECNGKTLEQIVTESVEENIAKQKAVGLVSYEHSEETGELVLVWESEEHHEAAQDLLLNRAESDHGVPVIDDKGEQRFGPTGKLLYYTPFGYLQHLFNLECQT